MPTDRLVTRHSCADMRGIMQRELGSSGECLESTENE